MFWIGNHLRSAGLALVFFLGPRLGAAAFADSLSGPQRQLPLEKIQLDSLVGRFTASTPEYIYQISPIREAFDPTVSFYYLLFLSLLLGGVHYSYPRYIPHLFRAFRSSGSGTRQGQEEISVSQPALLMNLFFVLVTASFIFHVLRVFVPEWMPAIPGTNVLAYLSLGLLLVYLVKFLYFRFCGWLFQMQTLARHYLYQVFLINQILSLLLLPAGFLIAFGRESLRGPVFWGVAALVILLVINRYTRSWPLFAPLVRNHRFHFFAYLCASEILPLAVILKLLFLALPL